MSVCSRHQPRLARSRSNLDCQGDHTCVMRWVKRCPWRPLKMRQDGGRHISCEPSAAAVCMSSESQSSESTELSTGNPRTVCHILPPTTRKPPHALDSTTRL